MNTTSSGHTIREMERTDYVAVHRVWQESENIGLNESDEEPAIAAFLVRNAGLSVVALDHAGRVVGAMLCGHDGRRGFLHHLAVAHPNRDQGIGRNLVEEAVGRLRELGIIKVNLFVFAASADARSFWEHLGWRAQTWQVLQKRIIEPAAIPDVGG